MLWGPLLVLLGMWCTGTNSQPALTQPPAESVSLGNTVKLSCTMSSGTSISGYYVNWYQQKPGTPPRYLLRYKSDSDKHQGSEVPARFSGSKDTSSNTGYLTIAGVLAEDEADYYCAVWHSDACHSDTATGEVRQKPPLPFLSQVSVGASKEPYQGQQSPVQTHHEV
ncbi:immunoglobulin lambda variable 5-39 [Alligator mississippiensis]|uniref:immunoglobulin lambda variable 5-39 n=1 Tax=Alligator mississippiensis TaxID=8496 RepID=UPI00287726E7|nr:immunoglobulin lambda variable 5-39 [Alligator mississippiensis]